MNTIWASKTADEILADIKEAMSKLKNQPLGIYALDRIATRRHRALVFNALKAQGCRKISIRDNGDGTAAVWYKTKLKLAEG